MRLSELGWSSWFQQYFLSEERNGCLPARVSEDSRGSYRVLAEEGEFLSKVTGKIRYRASLVGEDRLALPAVGDWVAILLQRAERRATITAILPRRTTLSRKAAGRIAEEQVLATNLDIVFVVSSLNQELNFRRIERYLTLVWQSGAQPVVLLNKADLCLEVDAVSAQVQRIAPRVPVHSLSAATGLGIDAATQYLGPGRTAGFIGSSGVGKSTIVNALLAESVQCVRPIRSSDDRGRHTTTSRKLIVLPSGGIVVDTPGMRELQLWENDAGLGQAFEDVEGLARACRFRNCRHGGEPGCAVAKAVEDGALEPARLENFQKMEAELRFLRTKTDLEAARAEKRHAKLACKNQKKYFRRREDDGMFY